MINILLMLIYALMTVSGLIIFKINADSIKIELGAKQIINLQIGLISLVGLGCYICSFFLYLVLVSKNTLGFLIPTMTGIVYILILTASVFILKEKITLISVLGSILILFGIILVVSQRK